MLWTFISYSTVCYFLLSFLLPLCKLFCTLLATFKTVLVTSSCKMTYSTYREMVKGDCCVLSLNKIYLKKKYLSNLLLLLYLPVVAKGMASHYMRSYNQIVYCMGQFYTLKERKSKVLQSLCSTTKEAPPAYTTSQYRCPSILFSSRRFAPLYDLAIFL